MATYEILTDTKNARFSISRIEYPNIWEFYKNQMSLYWTAEEIDFSKDYNDFLTLNEDEKNIIKMILAFFANSDGIVNFNINSRLLNEITIIEATMTYNYQMMMENIHNECYALMINTLIKNDEEREFLFDSIKTVPAISLMTNWALKWIENDKATLGERIVAFACVEGIMFSGAFAIIFWLKHYNSKDKIFMEGLIKSNNLISRDEQLHCNFACELYKMINNKLSMTQIKNIITDAVSIAQNFATESLKCRLLGLNSDLMKSYIEYVADHLIVSLGYEKIYNKKNPFTWMETIGMAQKTNFHETRPTEYQSGSIIKNTSYNIEPDDF